MRCLFHIFFCEVKRLFSPWKMAIFTFIFMLSAAAVSDGIIEYMSIFRENREFHAAEALRVKNLLNYTDYSKDGIGVLVIPAASGIFFSSPPVLSGLSGRVNSVAALEIEKNCKGKAIFSKETYSRFRFSVIVLFLGSLVALFMGAGPMNQREYLKFLSTQWTGRKVKYAILFSRYLLLILAFSLLSASMAGMAALYGISFTAGDMAGLAWYYGVTLLVLFVFLITGAILGSFPVNRDKLRSLVLVVWLTAVFFFPWIIDVIVEKRPNRLASAYTLYSQKVSEVNRFEMIIEKEYGKFNKNGMDLEREIVENYWNEESPKLREYEKDYLGELEEVIRFNNKLVVLTPVTYYNSVCWEVSSRGYENYIAFYRFLMDMQRDFLRFWIDRVYYHDPKQIVSFIKGDENLFRARVGSPAFFGAGAGVMSIYIIVLAAISYFCFGNSFLGRFQQIAKEETRQLSNLDIDLKGGMIKVWLAIGPALERVLFGLFSGDPRHLVNGGFKGKVKWEGEDLVKEPRPVDFLYMCRREEFPGDMKVKDLLCLAAALNRLSRGERRGLLGRVEIQAIYKKTLSRLKKREFFEVHMALLGMRKRQVYVINDIAADVPVESAGRMLDRMKELAASGALVVYLTGTEMEPPDEESEDRCFDDGEDWMYRVEARRRSRQNQKSKTREDGSPQSQKGFC